MADDADGDGGHGDALSRAVGARVAELRVRRGIATQKELAERAGMAKAYVWRIESGRQDVSLRNLARLCRALDTTLSALLEGLDISDVELGNRSYVRSDG